MPCTAVSCSNYSGAGVALTTNKDVLCYDCKIAKLIDRRLSFVHPARDEHPSPIDEKAKEAFEWHNYFTFTSRYKHKFIDETESDETYKKGATFEEMHALSRFDHRFRALLLAQILLIENHLKAVFAYELAHHADYDHATYGTKYGPLSKSYANLSQKSVQDAIASQFNFNKADTLKDHLFRLTLLRNACAHGSSIYIQKFNGRSIAKMCKKIGQISACSAELRKG